MWDIFKNAKKQFLIVSIFIVAYWGWEALHKDHTDYKEIVVSESIIVEPDTLSDPPISERRVDRSVEDDSLTHEEMLEKYFPEKTDSFIEEDAIIVQTLELRLLFWDMLLGHLSSILTSIAALVSPLLTVYLNKKGYFKSSEKSKD